MDWMPEENQYEPTVTVVSGPAARPDVAWVRGEDVNRFWSKVDTLRSECFIWKGTVLTCGYGQFKAMRRRYMAHRFAWMLEYGMPEKGLHLHHTCGNKLCVNTRHLLLLTPAEHVLDHTPNAITAIAAAKKECKHGHPLTDENVYQWPGKPNERHCLTCKRRINRESERRRRARKAGPSMA